MVLDKTGKLTFSTPRVAAVIPFAGDDKSEMLRLAACLEEHYPHSIANAVVAEAKAQGLVHEEEHSKVEYVVAHGISSMVDGERVVIGSYHFVVEDEQCKRPKERVFRHLPKEYSHLYLAIGGEIAAVICIEDPLRNEAPQVIEMLHNAGITNVVMMTGDNERTAKAVAEKVGVDAYFSEVLPEDKAAFIRAEHEAGRRVIMIGDGVNDALALTSADAGIAMGGIGSDIAIESADAVLVSDEIKRLPYLFDMMQRVMKKIKVNIIASLIINLSAVLLSAFGVLTPITGALWHNFGSVFVVVNAALLLRKKGEE
jgi:P-type E1-E2 ATPase